MLMTEIKIEKLRILENRRNMIKLLLLIMSIFQKIGM